MNQSIDDLHRLQVIRNEAITTYNAAMDQLENGASDTSVLELAYASLYLWRQVGDDKNLAIGYWLCSRAHALAGQGSVAVEMAETSLKHLQKIQDPADWLIASINEGWARALVAAADPRALDVLESTRNLIAAISDPEDRALIADQFSTIKSV
jgi:tRNA-dihydrouridine synthase